MISYKIKGKTLTWTNYKIATESTEKISKNPCAGKANKTTGEWPDMKIIRLSASQSNPFTGLEMALGLL